MAGAARTIRILAVLLTAGAGAGASACAKPDAQTHSVVVGTTHTVEDSGILDSIRVGFERDNPGQHLKVVVAGSGEVLAMGRNTDVDVLLTHAPADEKEFVAAGFGTERRPVAHNEFLVVGPESDPAHVRTSTSAAEAFRKIRDAKQTFISRGDDSGTERKEKAIWKAAAIVPDSAHYVRAGTGMADALRIADQKKAYTLTDVATYLTLQPTLALKDLYHGDPLMENDYAVTVVSKAKNRSGGEAFAKWITGPNAQRMIGSFGSSKFGRALFTADATTTMEQ